jgi:hypothetical protein
MELWKDGFPQMHTVFPDGAESGTVRVVHVTPSQEDEEVARTQAMFSFTSRGRVGIRAGDTYTQIFINGRLWMSDTVDERRDHWGPKYHAKGHVLIGGLGMGLVALAAALKPEVKTVTIIEINPDVIAFVVPYLRAALEAEGVDPDKLEVIEADVFKWKPPKGQMYQCLWFDIWEDLCVDNLKEIHTLNRRFARRTDPSGYRGCWVEGQLKYERDRKRREDRRNPWRW